MAGEGSREFTFATLNGGMNSHYQARSPPSSGLEASMGTAESKEPEPYIATRYDFGSEDGTVRELRHSDPLNDRSAPTVGTMLSSIGEEAFDSTATESSRAAARARVLKAIGEEPEPVAPPEDKKLVVRPATLSKLHVATMKQIFTHLDTDADGLLDASQLRVAIASVGIPPVKALVDDMCARTDSGPGFAEFEAFVETIQNHVASDTIDLNDVEELFARFGDSDLEDGVTPHMVRYVLSGIETSHQTQLHDDEVSDIFDSLGLLDSDSSVDPAALVQALSSGFVGFSRSVKT